MSEIQDEAYTEAMAEIARLKKLVREQANTLDSLSLLLDRSKQPATLRIVTELRDRAREAVNRL
jgi:hypothetical protein